MKLLSVLNKYFTFFLVLHSKKIVHRQAVSQVNKFTVV